MQSIIFKGFQQAAEKYHCAQTRHVNWSGKWPLGLYLSVFEEFGRGVYSIRKSLSSSMPQWFTFHKSTELLVQMPVFSCLSYKCIVTCIYKEGNKTRQAVACRHSDEIILNHLKVSHVNDWQVVRSFYKHGFNAL